jgi:hypothetical protein
MIVFKRKLWGTLSALTIIGIFLATSSQLLGAPVPGGPGFVSVGSLAFKPNPPTLSYSFISNRLYNNGGQYGAFFTPVYLPQGATITQLVLYFVDNGTSDISVFLVSYPLDDPAAVTEMAYMTTSGASPAPRTLVVNPFASGNLIDNQSNFYIVSVGLPNSINYSVGGVRIDYRFPTNLPLIMK